MSVAHLEVFLFFLTATILVVISWDVSMKVRIARIDALVIGLLFLFYVFIFLGEVVPALVFFVIAIAISLVALLKARSGRATRMQRQWKTV